MVEHAVDDVQYFVQNLRLIAVDQWIFAVQRAHWAFSASVNRCDASFSILKLSLTNISFLDAFIPNRSTNLFEHHHENVKTLKKLRTRYDAIKRILILESANYCDV